jgi:hypothetical protein
MFNISLLLDVSQNQFIHDPQQMKNLQFLKGSKSARFSRGNVCGRLPTLPLHANSRLCLATFLLGRQFEHQDESHRHSCRAKKILRNLAKTKRGLVEGEHQARQQAAHALAEDERLKVVGCIAAVRNVLEI